MIFEAESSKVRRGLCGFASMWSQWGPKVPRRPFWVLLATARQEEKEAREKPQRREALQAPCSAPATGGC